MHQVVIALNGGPFDPAGVAAVVPGAAIIAADGGLDHAVEAGLTPTHLVGDLDSISAGGKMWAYAHDVAIDEHPVDKDATDTELALDAAIGLDAQHLLVLGTSGGRFDHLIGSVTVLGNPQLACFDSITAYLGHNQVRVLHPGKQCVLPTSAGVTFSLLALHGDCGGVTVTGARWNLDAATISASSCRGLSNEAIDQPWITCGSGVLTVVLP